MPKDLDPNEESHPLNLSPDHHPEYDEASDDALFEQHSWMNIDPDSNLYAEEGLDFDIDGFATPSEPYLAPFEDILSNPAPSTDFADDEQTAQAHKPAIESQYDDIIVARLNTARLVVNPGATAGVEIDLLNNGSEPARFQAHVEGWLDARWVEVYPIHAQLRAGERTTLSLSITPTREPSTIAGEHAIAVVIRSATYRDRQCRLGATLVIRPYDDILLGDLQPRRIRMTRSGRAYTVTAPIYNNGNRRTQVQLSGDALHDDCLFEFRDPATRQTHLGTTTVTLEPGKSENIHFALSAGSRPIFGLRERTIPFRILARPVDKMQVPQAANGQFVTKPLIGPRRMAMVGGLLFAFLFLVSLVGFAGYTFLEFAASTPRRQNNETSQQPVVAIVVPVDNEVPEAAPTAVQQAPIPAPIVVSVGDGSSFPTGGIADRRNGSNGQVPVIGAEQISTPGNSAVPNPVQDEIRPIPQSAAQESKSQTYAQMFRAVGNQYDLDWRMLAAQAYIESSFDPLALGRNGDLGLMQILPGTWKEFAPKVNADDPFDSNSNVRVAAVYLNYLQELLQEPAQGDIRWVLVAYNWGPDEVLGYLNSGQTWEELSPNLKKYADDVLRIAASIPTGE